MEKRKGVLSHEFVQSGTEYDSHVERLVEKLEVERATYADVYKTSLRLFPQVETIRRVREMTFDPATHKSTSGGVFAGEEFYPTIEIGEAPVPSRQKYRWMKRLRLDISPAEAESYPDLFWQTCVFAHELGHALQRDEQFEAVFGELAGDAGTRDVLEQQGYKTYVNSDHEKNADYIAMLLMSETDLGKTIGLPELTCPPHEWRQWVVDL